MSLDGVPMMEEKLIKMLTESIDMQKRMNETLSTSILYLQRTVWLLKRETQQLKVELAFYQVRKEKVSQ